MVNYARKAIKGSAFVFVSLMIAQLFAYLLRLVLSRNLTLEEFGLFYSVLTFVVFFSFFKNLGLNAALIKYIAEFKTKKKFSNIKTAITSAFIIRIVSAIIFVIILFVISDFLGQTYFKHPSATIILRMISLILIFNVFQDVLSNSFNGMQNMFFVSLIYGGLNTLIFILTLIFLKLNLGINSPALAYIFSPIIIFLIFFRQFSKDTKFFDIKIKNFKKISKKLVLFGAPVLFTLIGYNVISYIDTLLLTSMRTLEEVGIYNVVLPSALLFLFFGKSVAAVMLPMVSELWAKKKVKTISNGVKIIYKYAFLLITPLVLTMIVNAKLFLKIFFGSEFAVGSFALQILLIGVLFFMVASINNHTLSGLGKPSKVTVTILIAAIINTILNIILIPNYGITGAAIATTVSYLIVFVLSTHSVRKIIRLDLPFKQWGMILISSLIFLLSIHIIKSLLYTNVWVEFFLTAIISGIVYIACILIFKLVDFKEIKRVITQSKEQY